MHEYNQDQRTDNTTTYNGWANHSTWAAHLHLANDEYLYREAMSLVASEVASYDPDDAGQRQDALASAGDRLNDWVGDLSEYHTGEDFIQTMLDEIGDRSEVAWPDVAAAFLPDEWEE